MPYRSSSCGHPSIFVFIWMAAVYGTSKFHCPPMVEMGSSVNLTCSRPKAHAYTTPNGGNAATCNTSGCIPTGNFTAAVINTTTSVLTIPNTQESHDGVWKCWGDADKSQQFQTCRISVVKIPKCEITSDQNSSSLGEGARLTLSVDLTRRVCSGLSLVQLITGSVSTTLFNGTSTDIAPEILTREFNVTSSHFGVVGVMYTCRGKTWNVSCGGVEQLDGDTLSGLTTSSTLSTDPPSSEGPDTDTSDLSEVWIGVAVAVTIIIIIIIFIILALKGVICNKCRTPANNQDQVPEGREMLQIRKDDHGKDER